MTEKEKVSNMRNKLLAKKVINNLESRKFDAYYCETKEAALQKAISLIPEKSSVSWGGSTTIDEIGLIDKVKEGNYTVIDRDKAESVEERFDIMRQSLLCDTYLTSFNAVSEDGILINIDGVGNRVAAISFGPQSVVAIVGMNKVASTLEGARERARTIAAPINAQRFTETSEPLTPCMQTGTCGECKSDSSICSYIVETRMSRFKGRIKVILVDEELGF